MPVTPKASIQVRLDEELKKNAEQVLENVGLDLPTAVRVFLKKVISTRSIPFSLEEGSDFNEGNTQSGISGLAQDEEEIDPPKRGLDLIKTFSE